MVGRLVGSKARVDALISFSPVRVSVAIRIRKKIEFESSSHHHFFCGKVVRTRYLVGLYPNRVLVRPIGVHPVLALEVDGLALLDRLGGEGAGAVRGGLVHLDFWIIRDKFRFISEKNEEILRILNAVNNEGF